MYVKKKITTSLKILAGTALMAVSVNSCFDEMGVVTGGLTGVAIVISHVTNGAVPVWLTNLVINIPLFLVGMRVLKRAGMKLALFGATALTVFLGVIPRLDILTEDILVNIILGSFLMGTGLGLVFSAEASSGGTDLMATIINRKIKYLTVPKALAIIDAVVVILGAVVFGPETAVYALIAIFIITKVADYITEGPDRAKLVSIISDKSDEISGYILKELERGASSVPIKGLFTKSERNMIFCIVSAKEVVKIKEKLYKIDQNAICFVEDVREVFGEGFTNYKL